MSLKKVFKATRNILLGFIAFILIYALAALLLSIIAVKHETGTKPEMAIYIMTTGVHTDVIVPVKNELVDWSREISYQNTLAKDTSAKYLALGWGDKGFFLNTPTWAQLKFSVAFKAAFALSSSAVHATFHKTVTEDNNCIKIMISKTQYQRLITYVKDSFKTDANGHFINIKTTANYDNYDAFYEAKGHYNLFYTCNTWANNVLKSAGQKASVWTPLDRGIFYHYR